MTGFLLGFLPIMFLVGLIVGLDTLAKNGILFTKVREGTAQMIMTGDSLVRPIISMRGHRVQEDGEIVAGHTGRFPLFAWLGWYWVGLPPWRNIYTYTFTWTEPVQENNESIMKTRNESTNFVFIIPTPYATVFKGIEIGDNVSVDIGVVLTIHVKYPARALFGNADWLQEVFGRVKEAVRATYGDETYDEMRKKLGKAIFAEVKDGDTIGAMKETELLRVTGAEVVSMKIESITISGAGDRAEKVATATTAVYVAKQEAEATRTRAAGDADAIKAIGEAKAAATKSVADAVKDAGEDGRAVLAAETIGEAGKGGNTVIIGAEQALKALSNLGGEKS